MSWLLLPVSTLHDKDNRPECTARVSQIPDFDLSTWQFLWGCVEFGKHAKQFIFFPLVKQILALVSIIFVML